MAMEKGTLSDFKGKKLDDIEIDPNGMSILERSVCVCAVYICKNCTLSYVTDAKYNQ